MEILSLCLLTAVIVTVVSFVYLYYKKKLHYWKSQGIDGPTPLPIIGNVLDFILHYFPTVYMKYAHKYGRVYGYYEGSRLVLSVAEPELLKQILIKDFHIFTNRRDLTGIDVIFDDMIFVAKDKQWKRLRAIISSCKIKRMKPLMERCIRNATDFLEEVAKEKQTLSVKKFCRSLTLEVIACCCFATNINAHKDPNNIFLQHVTKFVENTLFVLLVMALPKSVLKFLPFRFIPNDTVNFFKNIVSHLCNRRKEQAGNHNDFFQLIIEAEKENNEKNNEPLSESEIFSQSLAFFVAGFDTAANFLHWCIYAMAMNPKIQEKLHEEIKNSVANIDDVDYDAANKNAYLDAFISETFRMYPPVVNIERMASEAVELGDTGVKIPANTIVNIPLYAIHHDPQFYSKPFSFNPERFMNENKNNLNPYAYLPFGMGLRSCIAMRFALFEVKLALIQIVYKFKFVKMKNTPSALNFLKMANSLSLKREIFVNVERR